MTKAQIRKNVFLKSIPIMCSYIFVSMAYGIMMENAGFGWYYSLFVSLAFPKGIAVVVVAVSYKWKHNTLISIAVGTGLYMVLLRVL